MTILYEELKERLKRLDEITLMEVLEVSSEDLVERFDDRIEERQNELAEEFEDEAEESDCGSSQD